MTRPPAPPTPVDLALRLALDELHATLDVRPRPRVTRAEVELLRRPGPVRCDADRRPAGPATVRH